MDPKTREAVCSAAVRAAKAVNYVGAGTVEFIADGSGRLNPDKIWFMEMNTRLQVEHPVTEMITGIDLVEWQLRVASGEPIPKLQDDIAINGWAMEARLYAENPSTGFLPSIGKLEVFELPKDVRVDTGVEAGGEVSPFYDPMISKLITHGASREEARASLAAACDQVVTYPVQNNAGFIARLLREEAFANASVTTSYIGDHLERLTERPEATDEGLGRAAKRLVDRAAESSRSDAPGPSDIWSTLAGFRLSATPDMRAHIHVDGAPRDVSIVRGLSERDVVFAYGDNVILVEKGWPFEIGLPVYASQNEGAVGNGEITSPMPGRVIAVAVSIGDKVTQGQRLITLEAMKMEHTLDAPFEGVVADITVSVDAQIPEGAVMMTIEPQESD
eukprot:g3363.t1